MTRKKYIKFLMAHCISRNNANEIVQEFIISMGKSYYDAYMEDLLFMANYETDRMFFYRDKENPDIFYLTEPPDCKVKFFY